MIMIVFMPEVWKGMAFPNKFVKKQFAKIQWTSGSFMESKVKISNLRTENAAFQQVKKVAMETLETFMECTNEWHEKEDLPFTKAVSDLMDLRNREIDDLKKKENEERVKNIKKVEG